MEPLLVFGAAAFFSAGVLCDYLVSMRTRKRLTLRYLKSEMKYHKERVEREKLLSGFDDTVEKEVQKRIAEWNWDTTFQEDIKKAEYMALRREQENTNRPHPHREDSGPNAVVHRFKTRGHK